MAKLINKNIIKSAMALAYVTCKDREEADKISMRLLRKRLIACANIFPVNSMYWWKGKIAKGNEYVMIAKTNDKNFKKLESEIKNIHSYEIPCILRINTTVNMEYEAWMGKELKK